MLINVARWSAALHATPFTTTLKFLRLQEGFYLYVIQIKEDILCDLDKKKYRLVPLNKNKIHTFSL